MKLWFIFICFPLFIQADDINSDPVLQIDKQIAVLKDKIQKLSLEQSNEDIESQDYMIADWEKYSDEMEDVKNKQIQEQKLIEQIRVLEAKKAQILKERPKYG